MNFDHFFKAATGNPPYDYQRRLAGGHRRTGEFVTIIEEAKP
jgi:hypothetical protein